MVLYSAGAPGPATVKGSVFNTPVVASTDIFSSNLEPTYSPTTFRVYAAFAAGSTLTVMRIIGVTTVSEQLNGGVALAANAAYVFDVVVEIGESINIQYGVGCNCLSLKVLEVAGAVS